MESTRSNIVTTHDIKFAYRNGDKAFFTEDFTSLKFNYLFQVHPFPISTQFLYLDETEHSNKLFDCITYIINHVNNNGGFTVKGWYTTGEVKDQSNKDTSATVKSGAMSYHSAHIVPFNTSRSSGDVQRIVVVDQNHIDNIRFKVNILQD